jgi:hypothetical protein
VSIHTHARGRVRRRSERQPRSRPWRATSERPVDADTGAQDGTTSPEPPVRSRTGVPHDMLRETGESRALVGPELRPPGGELHSKVIQFPMLECTD